MSITTVTNAAPARSIFGLMMFTVIFSLVGEELGSSSKKVVSVSPANIIFGGGLATVLLTLLAAGGEAGAELAQGLAMVTFITGALVYGGPVWDALNAHFGSTPTVGTTPTTPTTPSTSTAATAADLAQLAG